MKLSEIKITPILESLKLEKIDDEIYFSKQYDNYISNSRLGILKANLPDPTKFFEGLQKNAKYMDCLIFGSAVHELSLQNDLFFVVDSINRPTAKAGAMADYLYQGSGRMPSYEEMRKASLEIDYYAKSWNQDKANDLRSKCEAYWKARAEFEKTLDGSKTPIYLDPKNRERLNKCIIALENDSEIQSLLHPNCEVVANEQAILCDMLVEAPGNKPFILKLKSKLDNFSLDPETNTITVNDVKTTGRYADQFENAVSNFSYYREMAFYSYLLRMVAKKYYNMEKCTIKSNFLVVETIPEYATRVVPMSAKWFKDGMLEFSHLLKLVAFYCCDGNGFEDFRTDI